MNKLKFNQSVLISNREISYAQRCKRKTGAVKTEEVEYLKQWAVISTSQQTSIAPLSQLKTKCRHFDSCCFFRLVSYITFNI